MAASSRSAKLIGVRTPSLNALLNLLVSARALVVFDLNYGMVWCMEHLREEAARASAQT
jgi:hypothetical protein